MRCFALSPVTDGKVPRMSEHCVRVTFDLGAPGFGAAAERGAVHAFTNLLAAAVEAAAVGAFDGDEFGGGECSIFMSGPDADRIFAVVDPLLRAWPVAQGGVAVRRYGPPGAPEQRVTF